MFKVVKLFGLLNVLSYVVSVPELELNESNMAVLSETGDSHFPLRKRSLTETEDFNGRGTCFGGSPCGTDGGKEFKDWLNNFMGASNLKNWYVMHGYGGDENFRGNNDDGVWINDNNNGDRNSYIRFSDPTYAASVTSFSMDIGSHDSAARLKVYDKDMNVLLDSAIPRGCSNCRGGNNVYHNFAVVSTNGMAGFDITGSYVEGNVGIDNVVVETETVSCDGKAHGEQYCINDGQEFVTCSWGNPTVQSAAPGTKCCNWDAAKRVLLVGTGSPCPF